MSKEKVFIVLFHKHSVKKDKSGEWETTETVEFVSQLRNKHYSMASAIGDYINRKIVLGARFNITDYDKFEAHVREKYPKQMEELDKAYKGDQIDSDSNDSPALITDQFGNLRAATVFDPA